MKFLVLLLVILYASRTGAQEFVCGFSLVSESEGVRTAVSRSSSTTQDDLYYRSGTIHPVIVFGKFKDMPNPVNLNALQDREGEANQRAESLLSIEYKGSLAHYFSEMSDDALTLAAPPGGIDTNWYESNLKSVSKYVGEIEEGSLCDPNDYYGYNYNNNNLSGLPGFIEEVLAKADNKINFGALDENGDMVYDKNGDGLVDMVALFVPPDFTEACGPTGTALKFDEQVEYETDEGNTVKRVIVSSVAQPGSSTLTGFPFMVGVMAHEYTHMMGLPELYDAEGNTYAEQSAGIGRWGLMGFGPWGWRHNSFPDGPNLMSAWSRIEVGWISPVTVSTDMSNVEIHDITSSAYSVYKIPISGSEYFLVANRQNTYSESEPDGVGSYYDAYAPASGLAIWHVDEAVYEAAPISSWPNNNEFHKFVDLECTDGLFSDKGYNSDDPPIWKNSVSGMDNLDYLSADDNYTDDHHGNFGDATDLWDGETYTAFTPYTNPSTAGYAIDQQNQQNSFTRLSLNPQDQQNVFTGIALRNIRSSSTSSGVMEVDIYLQYRSGPITEDTTWKDRITVGGDVTIESGATLTLEKGTEVRFLANTDDIGGDVDMARSELIVADGGTLDAASGDITFGSASGTPSSGDWYGIRVEEGGTAHLQGATIRDGLHCVQNEGGMLTGTPDCGLTIASDRTPPFSLELDEDVSADPASRTTVATYRVEDTEGAAVSSVTWSLAEVGTAPLEINTNGELIFNEALDFERLTEEGAINDHIDYQVTVQAAVGSTTLEQEVTVTIRNVDEAGVVTVVPTMDRADGTTSPPRQGEKLTAELMDPDREISGTMWTWERQTDPDDWEEVATSSGSASSTYTPQTEDVGQLLQVRVSYQDGEGTAKKNAQAETAAVVGRPGEPDVSEPVVGDGRVTLTWQAPSSDGGSSITGYEYQQSDDGGATWPAEGMEIDVDCQAETCNQPIELTAGLYAFGVRAVNDVGFSDWVRTSPIRISSLTIVGSQDIEFAEVVSTETEPRVVYTYTAEGVAGDAPVEWSLVDEHDDDAFEISIGQLRFRTPPDYEDPIYQNRGRIYHVTVQATASGQTATMEVEVEVTNQDDPGVVTLSSTQPEVDEPIRATLTDPDGSVENVRWSWLYFSSEDGPRNGEPTVVSSSDELIPSGVLMGLRLQAQALYADEFGTHHSAESVQTEPVRGVPSAPQNLTATPSDGSLVLAWDAPSLAGYPAFSGYRYRYKTTAGTAWQPSAAGALVEQTTRPTLEGLTHGKEYTVEVWAVNAQGAGPAATTTATPLSPDTPGRVELTSRRPRVGVPITATLVDPDAPVRVRRWQWLQSPWYYRSAGDSSLVAPSEERYPALASYEPTVPALGRRLRAVVDYTDQYGPQSAQSAWTAPVLPGRPEAPALSATAGDGQVALTWTAAADQGAAIVRYQYHRSDKPSGWLDVPGDGLDGHYTVGGLSNDADYTFKVRAVNSAGEGSPSNAVTATPQGPADPNPHAPAIAGPEEVSVAEGHTGALADADYTTSDGDGDAVTLTLTDAARGPFSLSSSGTLQVTSALDYERDDTRYEVTLTATDDGEPSKSSTKQVTVTVDNVDEAGTVTLSDPSPQVGDHLTATLSDPDGGLRNVSWSWQDIPRSDESDDTEPPRTTSYPYTVEASDEGRRIEVQARYTDAHGSGKTARATTEVVQEAAESNPNAPVIAGSPDVSIDEGATGSVDTYRATDADGDRVRLTLTDADGGPLTLSGGAPALTTSGELRVTRSLDYESDRTSYEVTLTATDDGTPSKSSTKRVEVTVDNVEEAGTVSLTSSSPQVGDRLTASLSDPDGYQSGGEWDWQLWYRQGDGDDASWVRDESVRYTADSYTVQASDAGRRLRAVISNYTDGHGSGKSAHSALTEPVEESNRHTPVISGPSSASMDEGDTGTLGTYTTSDGDGDRVTLTLTNADRGPFSLSSSGALRVTSALDYERDDTSYTVTLTATDDGTPSKSSTKSVSVSIRNVEEAGTVSLTSSSPQVGDRLTASLSDPDGYQSGGEWDWQLWYRQGDGDDASWVRDESVRYTADSYTVQASDAGRRLRAVISNYTDGHGSGKSAHSALTEPVEESNRHTPVISGPSSASMDEGDTGTLGTYTTSDGDGDRVTLTLTNADRGPFSLSSSGALRVTSALDYESDDTSYTVTLTATDDGTPSKSSTKSVSVSIRNVEEAGTVSLTSSSPRVGDRLTASLSDPDGYQSGGRWQWLQFRGGRDGDDDSWEEDESVRYAADSYTVPASAVGRRLRARISGYTDGHGSGKTAHSSLTATVRASMPGAPGNFTAEPGNVYTRVDLSWSAAVANGSAITRYEYRYKAPSGSWSSWTSVGVAYSTTVSGLSSGQRYSFEVRAVNGEGSGPSSSTSSLVRTPPAKPVSLQALPDTVLSAVAAPNPFNPTTTIHMQVPMRGVVWLTIYNVAGQVVRTLLDDYELEAGYHSVDWDGRDQQGQPVTSGVYLYHLRAGTQALVHKLLLLR